MLNRYRIDQTLLYESNQFTPSTISTFQAIFFGLDQSVPCETMDGTNHSVSFEGDEIKRKEGKKKQGEKQNKTKQRKWLEKSK